MDKTTYFFEKLTTQVKETEEDFIFSVISQYFEEKTKLIIPKDLLIDALWLYKETYPERYERMIKEAEKREG